VSDMTKQMTINFFQCTGAFLFTFQKLESTCGGSVWNDCVTSSAYQTVWWWQPGNQAYQK
jgi:hypothetical protein